MSTRKDDFRTTYREAVEAPIPPEEEFLKDHREEHVDSWEVKRSPELIMHMYHDELVHNDSRLADELVGASEGNVCHKDATWLNQDKDHPQDYPLGSKSQAIFYSSTESMKHVTHGDREQAAIILGYSMTKPVEDAVEQVDNPVIRERLESQLNYIQDRFRVSFTYNDISRYNDNVEHLQNITQEISAIHAQQEYQERTSRDDHQADYHPVTNDQNEEFPHGKAADHPEQHRHDPGHGQQPDQAAEHGNRENQTEYQDSQPINNPATLGGDEPTSYPDSYSSRRNRTDAQDDPQRV